MRLDDRLLRRESGCREDVPHVARGHLDIALVADQIGDVARRPTFRWIPLLDRTAEKDFLEALFFVVGQTRRSA